MLLLQFLDQEEQGSKLLTSPMHIKQTLHLI